MDIEDYKIFTYYNRTKTRKTVRNDAWYDKFWYYAHNNFRWSAKIIVLIIFNLSFYLKTDTSVGLWVNETDKTIHHNATSVINADTNNIAPENDIIDDGIDISWLGTSGDVANDRITLQIPDITIRWFLVIVFCFTWVSFSKIWTTLPT